MNVLIFSVNPQSPHMETDLEIAHKYKMSGCRVTIVRCSGQLRSCLVNPNHSRLICASCKSKYTNALRLSGLTDVNIIALPLPDYSYEGVPDVFANTEELKNYKFQGADLGVSVLSTLIGRIHKDHKFDTVKYKKEVYAELRMCIDIYLAMEKLLAEIKPDEVYFFNGRFSSYHPLKCLCIKNNITYFTHEAGGAINKYMIRKNAIPHAIDQTTFEILELWEKAKKDTSREITGAKFFTDRRGGTIESGISFTETQRKGLLPAGFDPKKKNIAIFNSTMEEFEGMKDWENTIYRDDNDGIARVLESFSDEKKYMFYLRVHPNMRLLKNTQMRQIEEMADKFKNLFLIRPEDICDTYALMDHADKVLAFASTMGAEATFWNKPSILLGKSVYMNLDACYQPSSHEEVVELIKSDDLAPKNKINVIKYSYWELMKGIPYERFKQEGVYTMSCNGTKIEASVVLRLFEKIAKLNLIRNKRGWDNLKTKIKNDIGWK